MFAPIWPLLVGCNGPADASAAPSDDAHFVLRGGRLAGGDLADVEIEDGLIVTVGTVAEGPRSVDISGRWLAPAVIDSHVHLAYRAGPDAMADGGVAGVVDLGAPIAWLTSDPGPVRRIASGPMITAVRGYPTQSWGADGYGLECADAAAAVAAVDTLVAAGAGVIKLPVTGAPVLDDAALAAAVAQAHGHGRKVAMHALGDADAARAALAGTDALAHTPVERLGAGTLDALAGKTVISTLYAFGGSADAVENLRALRSRGGVVLYGTDYGNTQQSGVDGREIGLLRAAGLDDGAIVDAMTSAPATWWGFTDLGAIAPGKAASLLVLDSDPRAGADVMASPRRVYIDGVER